MKVSLTSQLEWAVDTHAITYSLVPWYDETNPLVQLRAN